jgi:hypothetical protein
MSERAVVYTRELPGGGYVAIESQTVDGAGCHASLCVERRADPARRAGHTPPVIAEAEGSTPARVIDELLPIAADNVAVAQRILRWQARNRPRA